MTLTEFLLIYPTYITTLYVKEDMPGFQEFTWIPLGVGVLYHVS
jgi:hypothetical protein